MRALADALDSEKPAAQLLAFGIGCFHFGADPDTFDGNAHDHVARVEEWLKQTAEVSNVSIRDPQRGWFESDLPYGLEDGGQPFPAIHGLRLDFDLAISDAVRRDFPYWQLQPNETIAVSIRQASSVPVAFVVAPASLFRGPSIAVSMVWHTLGELVPPDAPFTFDVRGPSPAWLDCYLIPLADRERPGPTFGFERVSPPQSYATDVFTYDPAHYASVTDAAEALFDELENSADFYYRLIGSTRRLSGQWQAVDSARRSLLTAETAQGVGPYLRRTFSASRMLRDIAIALTEFEADVSDAERQATEERTTWEVVPGTPFLLDEIDSEIRSGFRFPIAQVERPLSLFERRRLVSAQNRAALAAALAAAAIGAGSALLISNDRSPSHQTITIQLPASGIRALGPKHALPKAHSTGGRTAPRHTTTTSR